MSRLFKFSIFSLGVVCLLIALVFFYQTKISPGKKIHVSQSFDPRYNRTLQVGGQTVLVEIVDTPETMRQGLSGRKELLEGSGMLFVFDKPQMVSFWMPDMHFPIDMIFIRSSSSQVNGSQKYYGLKGKVVYTHHDVPNPPLDAPRDTLPHYSPNMEVDLVLEVPSGWAEKFGIDLGSEILVE